MYQDAKQACRAVCWREGETEGGRQIEIACNLHLLHLLAHMPYNAQDVLLTELLLLLCPCMFCPVP